MHQSVKDAQNKTALAFAGLGIVILITIGFNTREIETLKAVQKGTNVSFRQLDAMQDRQDLMRWVALATFTGAAAGFLHWLYVATTNLKQLKPKGQESKLWQDIAWWFCPVICLLQPYLTMKKLWKESDPDASARDPHSTPVSWLIGIWWGTWLVGAWGSLVFHIIPKGESIIVKETISIRMNSDLTETALLTCSLVSLILATLLVKQISDNLQRTYLAQREQSGEQASE